MFAAMANGISLIRNCSDSEDVHSTINCFEKLGCEFEISRNLIKVVGKGFKDFQNQVVNYMQAIPHRTFD